MEDELTALRAEVAAWKGRHEGAVAAMTADVEHLRAENASLAAWQCVYTDGKTGLVGDEHGNQYCAIAQEVEAVRSANRDVMLHFDVLKADYDALRAEVERLTAQLVEAEKYNGWHQQACIENERLRAAVEKAADRLAECNQSHYAHEARAALSGADAPPKEGEHQ
jgi:hypothetical protein